MTSNNVGTCYHLSLLSVVPIHCCYISASVVDMEIGGCGQVGCYNPVLICVTSVPIARRLRGRGLSHVT